MKKLTPKVKKITMITGIAVVCVGVISFVILQHANADSGNIPAATSSVTKANLVVASSSPVVSIAPITGSSSVTSGTAGTGSAYVPSKGKTQSAPLTQTSKPSVPSKPVIQGDSKNGQQPTNKALTNKSTKPSYVAPPKASTPKYSGTTGGNTTKSNGSTTTNKQSNGGSTTGNKTSGGSDPIFGNKQGTGGQENTVGNPGDQLTGDKVGIMD